jgi:hypothetical protein
MRRASLLGEERTIGWYAAIAVLSTTFLLLHLLAIQCG